MGAWGPGIYQDDVTCDIKSDYLYRLRAGYTNEEATKEVIERNADFTEDEDDAPLFWFALADTQWKYGRLSPYVKEKALEYIKSGEDLERWKENKSLYPKRKKVLEELAEKLNSPQPKEKKVSKIKLKRPMFDVGDVLLYKIRDIKDNKYDSAGYCGSYVLIRIIGNVIYNIGSLPRDKYYHEFNVGSVYNWVGDREPNLDNLTKLEFLNEEFPRGYVKQEKFDFNYNIREFKTLDFKVILKDNKYVDKDNYILNGAGHSYANINVIDWSIINLLKRAEKLGELVDHRKK